jgi:hypothetical protein
VDALLAGRKALEHVGPRADVGIRLADGRRAVADGDDVRDVLAEGIENRRVRSLQS